MRCPSKRPVTLFFVLATITSTITSGVAGSGCKQESPPQDSAAAVIKRAEAALDGARYATARAALDYVAKHFPYSQQAERAKELSEELDMLVELRAQASAKLRGEAPQAVGPAPKAGAASFSPELWQPQNVWLYEVRHEALDGVADESVPAAYYVRETVRRVSEHERGVAVELSEEGGVEQPRTHQVLATDACLHSEAGAVLFCLGPDAGDQDASPKLLASQLMNFRVRKVAAADRELLVDPTVGVVRDSRTADANHRVVRELVGYAIGERKGGRPDFLPPTCRWADSDRRGGAPSAASKKRWAVETVGSGGGLTRPNRRFLVPVGGRLAGREAVALRGERRTILHVDGVTNAAWLIEGRVTQLHRWTDGHDDSWVALVAERSHHFMVAIARLGVPERKAWLLSVERAVPDKSGLQLDLVADRQGCVIRLREDRTDKARVALRRPTAGGLENVPGVGSLPVTRAALRQVDGAELPPR